MALCRASTGHCCHLGTFGVCALLRDDGPAAARRFVCTLRERLGTWDAVHTDPLYLRDIRPKLDEIGVVVDCGDWPPAGTPCHECDTHLIAGK